MPATPRCTRCGARLVPVVYGYPGPELIAADERRELLLGGCAWEVGAPELGCYGCWEASDIFATD